MKYLAEIHKNGVVIDEIETNNDREFLIEYYGADEVILSPLLHGLSTFFIEKINNTNPCYFSSINADGGFFIQYDLDTMPMDLLRRLFSIADVFGYSCDVTKRNRATVIFKKIHND